MKTIIRVCAYCVKRSGFARTQPRLTRILPGNALMFEQDYLQGVLISFLNASKCSPSGCYEKRMREGEGYTTDEKNLLASQLLAFCEGMLSRSCVANLYRPTDDFRRPLAAHCRSATVTLTG